MRLLAALLFIIPCALAQFCGPDEIPDKLAVNQNGDVALGCRYNECPKSFNDPGVKSQSAPKCGKRYYELSCGGPLQWVGGIPRGSNLNNVVPLQCCTAQKLRDSPAGETNKIVEPGQVFEGQVHYDKAGNVKGYDIIKNAQKIRVGEGRYAMSLTVSRLMCNPKRAAQFDNEEAVEQGFGDVAEGTFQGIGPPRFPAGDLPGQQFAQQQQFGPNVPQQGFGEQFGAQTFIAEEIPGGLPPAQFGAPEAFAPPPGLPPLPLAPLAPPVAPLGLGGLGALGAAGAGAGCFDADTTVETPAGTKTMDQLKVGDQVLAVHNNVVGFSPIVSFLHRLPEKVTEFQKISAGDSSVTLTPFHYIYTTPCDQVAPAMKYARDVVAGEECLVRIAGEKQIPVPIRSNELVRSTGVYNPMTVAGTIVADGFMASIHNVFDDTSFMTTLVENVQRLQKWMGGDYTDKHVELPWALQYALDYASKLF